MSFWSRWLGRGRKGGFGDEVRDLLMRGVPSRAGVPVTWQTALQVTTVLACVRVIAEGVAQLPLRLMQEAPDGRTRVPAKGHSLYRLLHRQPNEWMTSFEWRELMLVHAALTGNAYSLVMRDGRGGVREMLPLPPASVKVKQETDWSLVYEVTFPGGRIDKVRPSGMFHLRGPSWDGVQGMDAVRQAREAIGLAAAAESNQATFFGNGGQPSGILSTDRDLAPDKAKEIGDAWKQHYGGQNAGNTAVLWGGMRYQAISLNGASAQEIETRKNQVEEICRAWRVFPHMIGAGQQATTYASAEAFFTAHVVHCLGPWIERLEQTIERDLLSEADRAEGYYPKLFTAGLLRGSTRDRGAFYQQGIVAGWMTRNEARSLEDLNPIDGLDEPLEPLNMAPAGSQPDPDEKPET